MKGSQIRKTVAEFYQLDLRTRSRKREYAYPRQMAMFLCHRHTKLTLKQIARLFGLKCHTTVLHGIRNFEEIQKKNLRKINREITIIEHRLKQIA